MDVKRLNQQMKVDLETLTVENARHISVMNHEMGELRDIVKESSKLLTETQREMYAANARTIRIEADVTWLKKFFFIIATTSVGSLIVTIMERM